MRILAMIPARGGSKGIKLKNLKELSGKSLVQHTFEIAAQVKGLDRIILSTDDERIATHAQSLGIDVPFMRPAEFAQDSSPMIDVILHALDRLKAEEGYVPDALMLLQPTSPLRKVAHLERAIELLETQHAESVCSVIPLPLDICPHYVMKLSPEGYLDYFLPEGRKIKRRQDVVPAYKREGSVYLTRVEALYQYRNVYGTRCVPMIIDPNESVNIDTMEDWRKAEALIGTLRGA